MRALKMSPLTTQAIAPRMVMTTNCCGGQRLEGRDDLGVVDVARQDDDEDDDEDADDQARAHERRPAARGRRGRRGVAALLRGRRGRRGSAGLGGRRGRRRGIWVRRVSLGGHGSGSLLVIGP